MQNTQQTRQNMVDCQIHPMGVVSEALLNAYLKIPREQFVSEDKKGVAYIDEDIDLGQGRIMMEAACHARMIEALKLTSNDAVLDIGGASGYSAAILSQIANTVIAIEDNKDFIKQAQDNWADLNIDNVVVFQSDLNQGAEEHAPYKAILINGAITSVPHKLVEQLSNDGRLVCVERPKINQQGRAMIYIKTNDVLSSRPLFDANIPYLKGFEPKTEFVF